jgi:proline dehydrogenase
MELVNKVLVATIPLVPRPIVRKFAGRYIAGEEMSDAVDVVRQLSAEGALATLDVLGEHITRREEATAARDAILDALGAIERERLNSNVSIKLTQLGLQLDRDFCLGNVRAIVERAASIRNFVRIDMEDSSTTDDTIWVYREVRKSFPNAGIVLQAYMRRTEKDAVDLIADGLGHFRLCKGIYIEPAAIAFKGKEEVNANFLRVLKTMLERKAYVGIATHDSALVEGAYRIIREMGLGADRYEFQMLLGVRPDLRRRIIADGHPLRVYVPFGKSWYQYSIRRFKENPQVAGHVLQALFRGGSGH